MIDSFPLKDVTLFIDGSLETFALEIKLILNINDVKQYYFD